MIIGVPKEIKNHEYRVGMVPASVRELVNHGHQVIVETNAGMGIGFTDDDYVQAGAETGGNGNPRQSLFPCLFRGDRPAASALFRRYAPHADRRSAVSNAQRL